MIWIQIRTDILHSVGPDLGTNCLQWLSADDKLAPSKERIDREFMVKRSNLHIQCIRKQFISFAEYV